MTGNVFGDIGARRLVSSPAFQCGLRPRIWLSSR